MRCKNLSSTHKKWREVRIDILFTEPLINNHILHLLIMKGFQSSRLLLPRHGGFPHPRLLRASRVWVRCGALSSGVPCPRHPLWARPGAEFGPSRAADRSVSLLLCWFSFLPPPREQELRGNRSSARGPRLAPPPLPAGFLGPGHVLDKDLLTTEQVEMGDRGGRGMGSGHAGGRELSHREAQHGGPWNPAEAATTWQPGAAPGGPGTAPPAWGPIWAPRSGEAALMPALVGASPGCTHEGEVSSVWGLVGQGPGQTRLIPRVQHQVTSPEVTTENAVVDGSGWVTGKQVGRRVGE